MAPSLRAMLAHRREAAESSPVLKGEDAAISLNAGLTIVGVVIGAVVTLAILAAVAPMWFTSLADIGGVFSDPSTSTGNADADALLPTFGLLVAFGGLFAIVGLVLIGIKLKGSGN